MAQRQTVLRRFKDRITDATGTAAHPRRWRAFRPAIRLRRAANDNHAPFGIIVARVVLLTTLIALGVTALF
jgi:hypothetical protein